MQMETCEGVWLDLAEELRERFGQDRYDRWLKPLSVLQATEDELKLGAANKFLVEWIERHYLCDVSAALGRRAGRAIRLSVGIDSELFRKMRKSQEEILSGMEGSRGEEPAEVLDELPSPASLSVAGGGHLAARPLEPRARKAPEPWSSDPQTLETFVMGPSNSMAYTAAIQLVESPGARYNPFFVHGGCGLGKTHLLRGICGALRSRFPERPVSFLTGEEFLNRFVTSSRSGNMAPFRQRHRSPQAMVIDDIQLLGKGNKSGTQEEFLHTFNALVDAGHQVVISSDCHPKEMVKLEKSLLNRFLSGLVVVVGRPEFETRLEILRRMEKRARVPLREEVLRLLAERVRTNVRELIGAFNFLEERSAQEGRPLEPAQAMVNLAESLHIDEGHLGLSRIAERVGRRFGVPVDALVSVSRHRSTTLARQVAMYLSRKYTGRSLAEIGKFFGDRKHTSVKSAEAKVESLRQSNPVLARDIEKVIDSFQE